MAASGGVQDSMMVGVDRLDYSKGLEERMLGYEQFLHDHPEHAVRRLAASGHAHQPRRGRQLSGHPRAGSTLSLGGSTANMPTWTGSRSAI
jgi:hypothetical protein